MTRFRTRRFTYAEVLAAIVFLAIVMPVALRGVVIAERTGSAAERRRTALVLADNLLTEMIGTGEWEYGEGSGDFGEDYPLYRWELTESEWSGDVTELRVLTLAVTFPVAGRDTTISLDTLARRETTETE